MTETLKFIHDIEDEDTFRSNLYQKNILTNVPDGDGRYVLYTSKKQRMENADALALECNGLVYDFKSRRPLVIPPLTYLTNIVRKSVSAHIYNGDYDIFPIDNGTSINMYWWKDSWRISTNRSYDITEQKWGNHTYREMLSDILADDEEKFYNGLDKNHSYTFGIKHPDMHPFYEGSIDPIRKIWFIQSVDMKQQIPEDGMYAITTEFPNEINVPAQIPISSETISLSDIYSEVATSLDDYFAKGKVLYGYMLRSKNPAKTGSNSNILIESSLLQKIRNLYYYSKLQETARDKNYDRDVYITVLSYLDINKHIPFIKLFTQYEPKFEQLTLITSKLIELIVLYNQDATHPAFVEQSDLMKSHVETIHSSLTRYISLDIRDKNLKINIASYILTPKWLDVFYSIYTENLYETH